MDSEKLAHLRRLASCANHNEPWTYEETSRSHRGTKLFSVYACDGSELICDEQVEYNAAHIAAFNPAQALELLDELVAAKAVYEALSAKLGRYRAALEKIGSQARECILFTEEECSISSNWVARRCEEALKEHLD